MVLLIFYVLYKRGWRMEDYINLFVYGPLFAVYYVLLYLINKFRPPKKFSLKYDHHLEGIHIEKDEWAAEKIRPNETHIIEGSTAEGHSLYIEVTTHEEYNSATVHLSVRGETYVGQFDGATVDDVTISCGPLLLEMREPFRKWRIAFRGTLSNSSTSDDIFITFGGWWKPTSDAQYFYTNSKFETFKPLIKKNPLKFYDNLVKMKSLIDSANLIQYGQFRCELKLEGEVEDLRFRGIRQRNSSTVRSAEEFYLYLNDGNRLAYKSNLQSDFDLQLVHSTMNRANRQIRCAPLKNTQALNLNNHELLQFTPDGMPEFPVRKDEVLSEYSFTSNTSVVTIKRVAVNHGLSKGFALFRTVRESLKEIDKPHFEKFTDYVASSVEQKRCVLPFTHRACTDKLLTGGKGANLALLTSIENEFTVPHGVVVTTTAFAEHLKEFPEISKLIQTLGEEGKSADEMITIGERIQTEIMKSQVNKSVIDKLLHHGIRKDVSYAVRSSAVGEDGSELSSAGQLESALNVEFEDIPLKILECWCSNFRKEVISYRRTYGQIVNPPMAVVVQEMIVDGVAGVMFTADPVQNDDGRVVINAIKGLGEEIVSGAVTPDEITVVKKGRKVEKPTPCCLDDKSLSNLIATGLFLETTFGKPQDVEFVIRDAKVYLVQSRDVTGRDRESTFELLTELDDATLTDKEMFSTANIGEVAPFPWTPLEKDVMFELYDKVITNMSIRDLKEDIPRQINGCFGSCGGRVLMNIGEMFLRLHEVFRKDRLAEISLAGVELFNEEMFEQARERYGSLPSGFQMKRLVMMLRTLFFSSYERLSRVQTEKKKIEELTPKGNISTDRLFEIHDQQRQITAEVIDCHTHLSAFSSFTYIIVGMLIRGSEVGGMSQDMLSDFANVFSNCNNVISADVPSSLKKLAQAIKKEGLATEVTEASDEDALDIIREKGNTSAELLKVFLEMHGHRGPKELYLRAISWAEDPSHLVHTLKMMISAEDSEKIELQRTTDEIIDSLKCKPVGMRRTMMKYMVKQTHRGVTSRELAKNCLVKSMFELRKTTKMIAKLLVAEGFIPKEDWIFFMTMDEIKEVYRTRSAKIVSRAMRRRKAFSELEDRQYAHIIHGNPEPINLSHATATVSSQSLNGTVVCEGTVIARARVAKNLEEAKDTQPGEILITRCTDICWSPFFPIIKGIVTEIGGLLSHGAVVAREYGLPSLIAVEHATHVFQTGDLVELNTTKGTISKVIEETQ